MCQEELGTNIEAETIAKLAELPEIVAVKEATGSFGTNDKNPRFMWR